MSKQNKIAYGMVFGIVFLVVAAWFHSVFGMVAGVVFLGYIIQSAAPKPPKVKPHVVRRGKK